MHYGIDLMNFGEHIDPSLLIRLAQTLTTLDIMSGGRVVLGIGLGAVEQEYSAFGESGDQKAHAAMTDESLTLLNQLWSGDLVVHHGTYYTVDNVKLQPVPVQRPRIPIWVGGESKAALHRAARWDGWLATGIAQDGSMTKTPKIWSTLLLKLVSIVPKRTLLMSH